jgi:peptide/nickel transport system substrate-binding protein
MPRASLSLPLAASLVLLSCSPGAGPGGGTLSRSRNPETYVHATISDIDTLDPTWAYDSTSQNIHINIYETLVGYKGSSVTELEPLVAEQVPTAENGLLSKDGKRYEFPIRKGVRFHHGGEVAPEDVRYSLVRFMLLDREGGPASILLEPVAGVPSTRDRDGRIREEAYDKVTRAVRVEGDKVVLLLNKPFPPLLTALASWAPVLSKAWCVANGDWDGGKADWKRRNNPAKTASYLHEHANGTGPFMLDTWDHGKKEIALSRFDGYWRGPARLKRAVFRAVEDFQTRKLMLAAGDADSISADLMHLPLLEKVPGAQVVSDLSGIDMASAVFFVFRIDAKDNPTVGSGSLDGEGVPPDFFSDIHVRKAFAYSFDYDGFTRDVNRGMGSRARSFVPRGLFGYDPQQPVYEYDPKKAEYHFRKALGGRLWEKGFRFTVATNQGRQAHHVIATMFKRAVEAINPKFRIDLKELDWPTYLDQANRSRLPMFVLRWSPDYPDPYNFAFPFMHSQGFYPRLQRYRSAEADGLVAKLMPETRPAERLSLVRRLQSIAHDDVPTLFIADSVGLRVQRTWVKGFTHNPVFPTSPNMCPLYYLSKT